MVNKNIILIIIMIFFEVISQYYLQKATKKKTLLNFDLILGLLFQTLFGFVYFFILKNGFSLAIANTLVDSGGAIAIIFLGFFIFKQKLTLKQIIGIFIIMCGVILIS